MSEIINGVFYQNSFVSQDFKLATGMFGEQRAWHADKAVREATTRPSGKFRSYESE